MMTGWILLLLAQALLAAVGRISWHKKVGDIGFAYGAILVPIGCIAVTTSAAREVHGHTSFMLGELNVLGISLMQMFLFGAFAGAAFLLRRRVDYHKRLIGRASRGLSRPVRCLGFREPEGYPASIVIAGACWRTAVKGQAAT